MNRSICLALLIGIAGCSYDSPMHYHAQSSVWQGESRTPRKYGDALETMSSEERVAFYRLENDRERDLFLAEHGVDVRVMLGELLHVGMTASEVRQTIGSPRYLEVLVQDNRDETWIYYRFNGFRRSRSMVYFRDSRVTGWDAFLD